MPVHLTAVVLILFRPVSMPRIVGVLAWITAVAFTADAIRSGQPLRLAGAGLSVWLALWLWSMPRTPRRPATA